MQLYSTPLADALDALQGGQHSLTLYLEGMAARLAESNPQIEAFLPEPQRRTRLAAETQRLRQTWPNPAARPPLYGALVGVKDVLRVAGLPTHAGSAVPAERLAGPEAAIVTRLREAGAIILGKTVTTEFAYFEPGPTRNPHNLEHTPGGSSSGSAAAVAAGLCTLAVGTQTIGSVIRPAAFCGIVGFKPTHDRLPTEGLVYFSRTIDTLGLFTQDIAGMIRAAAALCDGWRADFRVQRPPVLGVPDGPYMAQADLETRAVFEGWMARLEGASVAVQRVPALEEIETLNQLHRRLTAAEFAREQAALYPEFGHLYRARTVEAVEQGRAVGDEELGAARANTVALRTELAHTMDAAGIDLWACPAAVGPAPHGLAATGDPNMNLPWTHAGLPVVTVPAGAAENGLPLGLQLIGRWQDDERLLAWAGMVQGLLRPPAIVGGYGA